MSPSVIAGISHFHPIKKLVGKWNTPRDTFLTAAANYSLGVVVAQRNIIRRFLCSSWQRECVILVHGCTSDRIYPVGPFAQREGIGVRVWWQGSAIGNLIISIRGIKVSIIVTILCQFGCIHDVELLWNFGETDICFEANTRFVCIWQSLLSGDDDNTITTFRTIDSRRRCILQYRNGFDIGGVQVVQVMNGIHNTIDYDQWFIRGRDWTCTTDTDRSSSTRFTGRWHNIRTGNTSLQSLVDRKYRSVLDISHFNIRYGTGQIGLLNSSITDNYDFVQGCFLIW